MQLVVLIYLNSLFNIWMIVGNVLYFGQDLDMKSWCRDVSGAYLQIMPITFLLLLFGWAQMAYNIAIQGSICVMKMNGIDPTDHESDNDVL